MENRLTYIVSIHTNTDTALGRYRIGFADWKNTIRIYVDDPEKVAILINWWLDGLVEPIPYNGTMTLLWDESCVLWQRFNPEAAAAFLK